MAVTNEQKIDFLLKKIGFTKTKTGSVVGTGAISGTPKQPFAEAIPSPLIIANGALWNESGSIPTTPPGSDTAQVKVYLAATSGLRMTADATSSNQRAYIAYSTYGNASSTRLTNWIDTQFGSAYLIKVYKGDPNSGGVALSAAGSGANDGWFFDYSAGVLNFNDTSVPSGVTDTNIYIVGYRYIGSTGAPTPTGGGNFTFNDLVVSRNFSVGGLSTFTGNIDANGIIEGIAGENKIPSLYANLGALPSAATYHGMFAHVHATGRGYFAHAGNWLELVNKETNGVVGTGTEAYNIGNINAVDGVFSGNVSIGGTLTYEDVKNVDAVGLITARSGIRVTGGVIEAQAGENKIPSLYSNMGALPSAGSYHGMFAHVHSTGRGYFAHAGNWLELVNREINGVVGTGTERYNVGPIDAVDINVSSSSTTKSLNVTGVTTAVTVDINGDLDVDGHTNLDNVNIVGVASVTGEINIPDKSGNSNWITFGDSEDLKIWHSGTSGHLNNTTGDLYIQGAPASGSRVMVSPAGGGGEIARFTVGGGVNLYYNGSGRLSTRADGVRTFGTLEAANLNVTGVTTAVTVDVNGDLDVDGHTNLDNVSIAGVTTFTGNIGGTATFNDIDVDGHTNLDNVSIAGVTSVANLTSGRVVTVGTAGKLQDSNNLRFDGTDLFVSGIRVGAGGGGIIGLDISTRNLKATGLSTFVGQSEFDGNVKFDSTITAGGSAGTNGQYLKTTGSGVEWATFPTLRTRQTFTASSGQTAFSFSYTINFIDVFVNGIKLTDAEFTATNGSTVVLAVGCFVGDIVELVSYNTVSGGGGGGGGGGGISNIVEDTTPQLGGNLDLFNKSITGTGNVNITGIISATSFKGPSGVTATFIGDGSGLTNVIGSGSGVVVKDDGNVVGTAGTIDFGQNISVTPISAGIVTVGVTSASLDINKLTVTGITTFVGITTFTNEVSFRPPINGKVNFYGSVEGQRLRWQNNGSNVGLYFNNNVVSYYGNDNRTQISPHGNGGSSDHFRIWQYRPDGKENQLQISSDFINIIGAAYGSHQSRDIAKINYHDGASFYHFGNKKFQTSGVGVTITSQLDVTNINASGVTTTTEVRSNALSLKNAAGSATYATFSNGGASVLKWNNTNRLETTTSGVTVTGTVAATSYTGDGSQLTGIVAGITTISGVVNIVNDLDVDGHTNLDNVNIAGVVTATTFSGTFIGDGSGLTGVVASGSGIVVKDDGSTVGTAGTVNFTEPITVTPISAGITTVGINTSQFNVQKLNVSGVTTTYQLSVGGGGVVFNSNSIYGSSRLIILGGGGSDTAYYSGGTSYSDHIFRTMQGGSTIERFRINSNAAISVAGSYGTAGQVLTSNGSGSASTWTTVSGGGGGGTDVGITTNLSGSFTASAGTPATINTFAYHDNDKVVEYTVYIKNGSDFQSQKLLAMRDGTTIHSTQFAVMFSSSLLVQCDATISSGNILLRATPETGVSGSTTYKIKREVM